MKVRRRVRTAAVAVVLAAAACTSNGSDSLDKVRGTVLDQRTGKPVARARVVAATPATTGVTGTSDAAGGFTLRKVDRHATLRVTASAYEPATLPVAKGPLQIRLKPIPVLGRVTSQLTLAGLQATLSGPVSGRARPDGSFELYGVRYGDELTVSAPGYNPRQVTVGAVKVDVALSPVPGTEFKQVNQWLRAGNLDAVWRYLFSPLPGFEFGFIPRADKAELAKAYTKIYGGRSVVKDVELRSVTRRGAEVGFVVAIAYDPRFAASKPDLGKRLVAVVPALNGGAPPRPLALRGGITVPYLPAHGPDALNIVPLLLDQSISVQVFAPHLGELKAFLAAFFGIAPGTTVPGSGHRRWA